MSPTGGALLSPTVSQLAEVILSQLGELLALVGLLLKLVGSLQITANTKFPVAFSLKTKSSRGSAFKTSNKELLDENSSVKKSTLFHKDLFPSFKTENASEERFLCVFFSTLVKIKTKPKCVFVIYYQQDMKLHFR